MSSSGAMASIVFPSEKHRAALRVVLATLDAGDNVRGVLLPGSLARETARDDFDLDVLVVVAERRDSYAWRHDGYDLPMDFGVRTVEGWIATFAPDG